jgi:outer membrane protein OmpA-like peptidoglycan-associated protein
MSKLSLRLHADEEHWIPLSDLMTGLMFLFLLISLAYMVAADLKHAKPAGILKKYAASRASIYNELYASLGPNLQRWHASIDPQTLSIRFKGNTGLFEPGSAELTPQFQSALAKFFPQYVHVLQEHRVNISEVRIEGFTSTRSSNVYLDDMDLSQARARSVLRYVMSFESIKPAVPWLTQMISTDGFSYSRPVRQNNGGIDAVASDRVEFHILGNANATIAAALQVTPRTAGDAKATPTPPPPPTINASLPAYPSWAIGIIGRQVRETFPQTALRCYGYLDAITARYVGRPGGMRVTGWAFDMDSWQPVKNVLLTDARGIIVGAAQGGYPREDVQNNMKWITSPNTGWVGSVSHLDGSTKVWAVMSRPHTVCRLNVTPMALAQAR